MLGAEDPPLEGVEIPRRLHRYWCCNPAPAHVNRFEREWRKLHPSWQITTWRDASLPDEVLAWLRVLSGKVSPSDVPRHRANCLRYWLLAEYGGVWVDVDVRPLKAIDAAVGDRAFVATLKGHAEGAVMGGPSRDAFFVDLVESLDRRGVGPMSAVEASGADYLHEVASRHEDLRRCPPSMWFTYSASGRPILGDSFTEHLWAKSRLGHKEALGGT